MTIHLLSERFVGEAARGAWWKRAQGPLLQFGSLAAPFAAHMYYPLPCPMKVATGLDCPGCGGTRAAATVAHGDPLGSLNLNAAVIVLPMLVVLYALARRFRPGWPLFRIDPFWLLMAVLGVWIVLRNAPGLEVLLAAQ